MRPRLHYLAFLLFFALLLSASWAWLGRSHPLADAIADDQRLQCVSYSPFGREQSPFDLPLRLDSAQLDADLALLAQRFSCIRLYSMSGLEALPALARKHGLTLLLGAWVNADPRDTEAEIRLLIETARAYPDVVRAVLVGNETLLRREVTAAQLARLIERVRDNVPQPVSYADVWEFWLRHPEIAPAVDFLTVHLLPYWEDEPKGIDSALDEAARVHDEFVQRFAPKDILIGETGWPSQGRQRETAVPSPLNQARFIRGFVQQAEAQGWRYNLIEAFDQPWKRRSEGTVGGYWGLFDADRADKGVLSGPVSNLPDWPVWLALALALYGAALLLAGPGTRLWLPPLAALGAGCVAFQAQQLAVISRSPAEWLWGSTLICLNLLVLAQAALSATARRRTWPWLDAPLLLASGFAGAVLMLGLVLDARYRGFSWYALLFPAIFFLLHPRPIRPREGRLLAGVLALGIPLQLWQEGIVNGQAVAWALTCALLAVALMRAARRALPAHSPLPKPEPCTNQ